MKHLHIRGRHFVVDAGFWRDAPIRARIYAEVEAVLKSLYPSALVVLHIAALRWQSEKRGPSPLHMVAEALPCKASPGRLRITAKATA